MDTYKVNIIYDNEANIDEILIKVLMKKILSDYEINCFSDDTSISICKKGDIN